MPTVSIKFIAGDLAPGLSGGDYSTDNGGTVRDLFSACERQSGVTVPPENYKFMYLLLDGRPVTLDSPVSGDGTLHVCRAVLGG
ncbi:MAG: hypothetical protein FWG32_06125 [Oscillospiraceae bacterium]|nr:hypothetical protein [Oscillospiraceae bacterium]